MRSGVASRSRKVPQGLLFLWLLGAAPAQAEISLAGERQGSFAELAASARAIEESAESGASPAERRELTEAQVRWRTIGTFAAGAGGLALYANKNWWGEGFTGKFRTANEGWFGQNTSDGGADKLGHAFATYVGTRVLARAFEWAGNDQSSSLRIAAWSVLGTFAGVEVLDGFTTRWRFSRQDAIMNAVGVGLALVMEKNPALDRLIDLRLQYKPSDDPTISYGFDPIGDYSGQKYLMVVKASGIPALREYGVMRYFELALGYGTRGYHVGPGVPGDRSRNLYFGVSINVSELLDRTVFRGASRGGRTQRIVNGILEFAQPPGTAILADRRL